VYGVLKTGDAVSDVDSGLMTASFVAFTGLFAVLLVVNVWLLVRYARRGPDAAKLGAPEPQAPSTPTLTPTF
jgi:cytochrome d ubiquinol oxidase subunit I